MAVPRGTTGERQGKSGPVESRERSQADKFKEAARELGCDESEERFEEALRKIGRKKPPQPKGEPKKKRAPAK